MLIGKAPPQQRLFFLSFDLAACLHLWAASLAGESGFAWQLATGMIRLGPILGFDSLSMSNNQVTKVPRELKSQIHISILRIIFLPFSFTSACKLS